MRRLPSGYVHEIRRTHLGRWSFTLSKSYNVARQQKSALNALADAREKAILDRIVDRSDSLTVEDVVHALSPAGGGLESLRPSAGGVTLGRACETFLTELRGRHRRSSTLRAATTITDQLRAAFGANTPVYAISETMAREWFYSRGWSPATQSLKHVYIKKVFEHARELEDAEARATSTRSRLEENVWGRIKPARAKRRRWRRFMDIAEVYEFLDALPPKERAFMACGYLGALRIDEASNLRWEDVDLRRGLLHIREHAPPFEWHPKSERGTRSVHMAPELVQALDALDDHGPFVFGGRAPLTPRAATALARRCYLRAGLDYGRPSGWTYHHGRHSAISNAIRAGVSYEAIAEQAGDTVETIISTYSHIKREDARTFAGVLQRPSTSKVPGKRPERAGDEGGQIAGATSLAMLR